MTSKKFKVIYLPENSSKMKEFNFSRIKLFLLSAISLSILILITIYSVNFLTDGLYNFKLRRLNKDKIVLRNQLFEMEKKVGDLKKEVEAVIEKDDEMRVLVDLPQYDEDVRNVGVGGGEIWKPELSSFYSDEEVTYARMLEGLEKLERQIELEKESYQEIHEKLKFNKEMINYWPAIRPVEGGRITDGFGYRYHPFTGAREYHKAIDISVSRGTPVYAAADGIVKFAGWKMSYGRYIKIDHSSERFGFKTAYAHLNGIKVKNGQKVKRGDIIGEVGTTGTSTAPHLHYEVWLNDTLVNPVSYYYDPSILE